LPWRIIECLGLGKSKRVGISRKKRRVRKISSIVEGKGKERKGDWPEIINKKKLKKLNYL